jgi:hypothetical protein
MMSSEDYLLATLSEGYELFEVWELLGEPHSGATLMAAATKLIVLTCTVAIQDPC